METHQHGIYSMIQTDMLKQITFRRIDRSVLEIKKEWVNFVSQHLTDWISNSFFVIIFDISIT